MIQIFRAPAAWMLALALSGCGGDVEPSAVAPEPVADTAANAAAAPQAAFDLQAWVALNADCKGEYVAEMQDPAFAKTLSAAGVRVSADSGLGEVGPGGGTLTADKPLRLHGLPVRQIDYYFGSGARFAVVVEAGAEQARAAIDAQPLPPVYRDSYRLGVPTAVASEDVPMPDIRFVSPGQQAGTQDIGCAAFDM